MPWTDQEMQSLMGNAPPDTSPLSGIPDLSWGDTLAKRGKQIANVVPQTASDIFQDVVGAYGAIRPGQVDQSDIEAAGHVLPKFDTGPSKGITDPVLNDIIPQLASWAIPFGEISKGAKALGAGGIIAEGLAQGGANFLTSAGQGDQGHPLDAGILGASSGIVQAALPRWQRALPLAAISALDYAKTGNALEAGGNFVGNMLPGAFKASDITAAKLAPNSLDDVSSAIGLSPTEAPVAPSVSPLTPKLFPTEAPLAPPNIPEPLESLPPVAAPAQQLPELSTQTQGIPSDNRLSDLQLAQGPDYELNKLPQDWLNTPKEPTELPAPLQGEEPQVPAPLSDVIPPETQAPTLASPKTSQDIWDNKNPTAPIQGTPQEVEAIRTAYNNQAQKTKFPDVAISDVLRDAEIDPERGKEIIADLYNKGEVPRLSTGDWSLASEDKRMGGMRIPSSGSSPELQMMMKPAASSPPVETPQISTDTTQNKVIRYYATPEGKSKSLKDAVRSVELTPEGKEIQGKLFERYSSNKEAAARIDELNSQLNSQESEAPQVMGADGNFMDIQPKQAGPHIISTVLDEGQGQYLAGQNWNDPHMEGDNSIFSQHVEEATGLGNSAFLVKDEQGNIRVTDDRAEAGKIADIAGQRTPETMGTPLQSQDLVTPKNDIPTPQQTLANETAKTQNETASLESQLRGNLAKAKENNDSIGIRVSSRKLQEFLTANKPEEAAAREAKAAGLAKANVEMGGKTETTSSRFMKQAQFDVGQQRGSVSPETLAVIAVGGISAGIIYQQTKGDIGATLAAGMIGAGLGFLGAKAIQSLRESVGPEAKIESTKLVGSGLKARMDQFATNTMRTPGGMAVFGRGGITANAVRAAEGLTGLNGTSLFRDGKLLADGYIAHQLEVMSSALEEARPYNPSPAFKDASTQFLRGQLADQTQVTALIKAGGGVTSDAFEALSSADKAAYPEKWIITDDLANTSGNGTEVFRVTNTAKATLNRMQLTALNSLVSSPDDREFMKFITQSRETIDNVMQVVHDGLPPGKQRNTVLGTMGQYMSRSHALLTDPKYYPTENEIQGAMDRLGDIKEGRFLKANNAAAGTSGTIPVQYKGQTFNLSLTDKEQFDNLHTPESLRQLVTQYIKEIKQTKGGITQGLVTSDTAQLGTSLFAGRKQLDEVTQALLGTHEAPLEMVQNTLNKLIPTARASHFMSSLITMADDRTGLSHAYSSEIEYNRAVNDIKQQLRAQALTPVERQAAQTKLQELSSYVPISGNDPKFGIFQGSYVSRMANDQLAGYNGPFGILDNAIGKGLSQFNQLVKDTHLVLNPITQVRNIMQIPMFLAMGNAASHPDAWMSAIEALKNPLSTVGRRLTLNGVFAGNPVHGEFNEGLQQLLSGDTDRSIWNILKKGKGLAEKLYAMPDNFVRASVYLAEEARAAKKFNVSVDDLDPRVMAQARTFMSRRTLDYANVPTWVKAGRQIPFVSMYLSYTHEIMRVAANMGADALKGDFQAGATLVGIASTPFILQNMAENRLSPTDKQAWDKANAVAPPYSRYRFKLPIDRNPNGSFNYLDITPLSHFSDFQMMGRAIAHKDLGAVGAVNPFFGTDNTPLLSLLSEQVTGQDAHTGRVYRNPADRALAIAREIVPPHTPGIGYEYIKDMPEALGGDLGVTNLRNGRTNTIAGTISRHLTGVDYTQVDPGLAEKAYVASAQQEIANERQYLMDTLKTTGLSDDAKKRATDRFVGAVHHITEQMQTRLQLVPQ